jgi:c-di-GMP-binding flagellar brake protein YcgR
MFERARALWRRLTGRSQPEANMPAKDDRRVWVRFPADVATTYERNQAPGTEETGVIRDISQGGMKLEVEQPHEEGEMLTVGLQGQSGHSPLSVLACVVHCSPLGPNRWSLGCSFSQELSDADLSAFGAARTPTNPDPAEQRAYQRYKVNVHAHYVVIPADEDIPPRPAHIHDISATGIGLLTDEALSPGTLLSAELKGSGKPFTILACIVRVVEQENGQYLVGCSFIRELTEADLKGLL